MYDVFYIVKLISRPFFQDNRILLWDTRKPRPASVVGMFPIERKFLPSIVGRCMLLEDCFIAKSYHTLPQIHLTPEGIMPFIVNF